MTRVFPALIHFYSSKPSNNLWIKKKKGVSTWMDNTENRVKQSKTQQAI